MRKFTIIFFFILFLFVVPFSTSAQTEVIYPSLPGVLTPQEIANEAQTEAEVLPLFMAYLFRLILLVSLLVVIGVVLYAGILYLLSTGNPIRSKIAREWILSAIQGALVIFTSYALLFALDSQLVLFGQRNLEKGERFERVDLDWEIRNSYFQIPFGLLIEDAILNENAKNKLYDVLDATNEAEVVAEAIYQGSKQLLAIIESCPIGMPCGGGGSASNPGKIPFSGVTPSNRQTGASIPPLPTKAQNLAANNQSTENPITSTSSLPNKTTASEKENDVGGIGDPSVVFPSNVVQRGDNYSITAGDAFIVSDDDSRMSSEELLNVFTLSDYDERQSEINEIKESIKILAQDSWMRSLLEEQKKLLSQKEKQFRDDRIGYILNQRDIIKEPGNIPFGGAVQEKVNAANYLLLKEGYFADLYNNPEITFEEKNNVIKEVLNIVDKLGLGSEDPRNYGFNESVTVYDIVNVQRWWYPTLKDGLGNIIKDENGNTVYSKEASYALARDIHIARGIWGTPENITEDNGTFIQKAFTELGYVSLPILDDTHVNSNQGWRNYTSDIHQGTDFSVTDFVTKIIAVADQYIAETHIGGGEGVTVVSQIPINKNTYIEVLSSHLSGTEVAPGMTVSAGTVIGKGGNTGHSTGPHLHWEARLVTIDNNGEEIDSMVIRNDALFSPKSINSVGGSVTNQYTPFVERLELESILFPAPPANQDEIPSPSDNYNYNFITNFLFSSSNIIENELISPFSLYFSSLSSSMSVMADEKSTLMQKIVGFVNQERWATESVFQSQNQKMDLPGTSLPGLGAWSNRFTKPQTGEPSSPPINNSIMFSKEALEELLQEALPEEALPQEEETPPAALCCPPCPNIAPLVQAKIAEIESYFPIFLEKLEALLQTKEPIKEDLFQLYKAVMIKSLGAKHLIGYNSLLLARRHYEKEEIVIRTDEERTEIGRYYWDWSQWLYNTLYRIETGGKIVEENDPVTFYLQNPLAKKIVEDATSLALAAKEEGIQDAGNLIGVPRKMPPPPPDFGTKFYPPTNPEKTRITSFFGWRYDPFTRARVMHYGVDFAGPRYSPIYAAEKGEVVFAGWMGTQTTGYGVLIAIYHKASEINELAQDAVTYYAHLEPNSLMVKRGDIVSRGQHIAGMGTTGRSTGYHLHYETRLDVSYPYVLHTGTQVSPEGFIDLDYYSSNENYFLSYKENLLEKIFQSMCIKDVSAQTDFEVFYNYLIENDIKLEDLTEEQRLEILSFLGISDELTPLLLNDVLKLPSDFLTCGMEIPVGETFELTWDHLVELLDTIDYYVSEGERLIEQQKLMNELSRPCSCPCAGDCCDCIPPFCGGCVLTCNLGAIRAAHNDVAKTRQKLREIAAHIELLTDGHFNTPTEEICDDLNEDIRNDEERILCAGGGSKLITKHELITRKLNYSRTRFDECITRPEQIDDVLSGNRPGKTPFFGPIAEENQFKRYTKTTKDGILVNTSDFNWFCCSDSEE